jgi:hypothetical protein
MGKAFSKYDDSEDSVKIRDKKHHSKERRKFRQQLNNLQYEEDEFDVESLEKELVDDNE